MANLSAILCGVAGEYFVAAELTRRGYIASITLRNTRGIDILASNETASRQVGLQVKSSQKNAREWILSRNAEDYFADNLFYAFVNLKTDQERPDFFIVPSKIVAESVKDGHARWLKAPGRHGQPHKDSNVRKFQDHDGEYLESWSLLSLEAVMNSGPHPPAPSPLSAATANGETNKFRLQVPRPLGEGFKVRAISSVKSS